MNDAIPSQAIVAISTVVAALITGVIAMVSLTLSKEQKISELRQAWIDGLRADLATLLSNIRFLTIAIYEHYDGLDKKIDYPHKVTGLQATELKAAATESLYRVKLRLNKNESPHNILEDLIDSIVLEANSNTTDNETYLNNMLDKIEQTSMQSRIILKAEWDRVKRGENAFNNLRRWLVPVIVVLMSLFSSVILLANFK